MVSRDNVTPPPLEVSVWKVSGLEHQPQEVFEPRVMQFILPVLLSVSAFALVLLSGPVYSLC